ncbi:MAG: NADH-quinone oxidoreductase subunit NuoE [Desulfosalsimonadaceae bacterium]
MLTLQEKKEIEALLPNYPTRQAAGIDALVILQRRRGWISDETLFEAAGFLEMTPAELDSVATFYNLIFRKPVGRHVILVCDSVSCWVMGYDPVLDYLKKRLGIGFGETTADGRFTLLPHVCLGACDKAPAMMIDDDLHVELDPEMHPEKIDQILLSYP